MFFLAFQVKKRIFLLLILSLILVIAGCKTKEEVLKDISNREYAYNMIQTLYNSAEYIEYRKAFGEIMEIAQYRKYLYPDFTKNWFAIDNEINAVVAKGRYQSRTSIMEWYTECHFFNPTFSPCEYDEEDKDFKIIRAARSVKDKRRKMVELLSTIEEPTSEYALDFKNNMRKIDPFIVDAYEVLGKERIEELRYNQKKMNADIILAQRKGNKVVRLIKNKFSIGRDYLNETIVNEITKIFETLNIHPEKEIKPSIILDYFQAVSFKSNGKRGYTIVSAII